MRNSRSRGINHKALGLVVALAALTAPAAAADAMPDEEVTDVVERELIHDRAVDSNEIDVSTAKGIVTLTGTVNNVLAHDRAARIAETVKGVRSVVNRVQVEPLTPRNDTRIRQDVESALLMDPATDSYEVDATVSGGTVTLTGTVQSWREKKLSARVAKGVRGVKKVVNDITISYEEDRIDSEIEAEIDKALHWNDLVDDGLIDVTVKDGKVTLSGIVGSAAEKRLARLASWTAGVQSVDASGLKVERWARDDDMRKQKYVNRAPKTVEQALRDAFIQDPRVYSFNIEPSVSDGGIVTLRGTVDNLKAKRTAEEVARRTVGVYAVRNNLKVRYGKDMKDSVIARNVRNALRRDPWVDRYEVTVNVYDGVVHLSGDVDTYFEKAQADDVAARAPGVTRVTNNLSVEGIAFTYDPYIDEWSVYHYPWYTYDATAVQPMEGDQEIKTEINDELWWSPFVDSDEITVTVEDGVATLVGTVDSWSEWRAARKNAYEGGAVLVRNRLLVEYDDVP